MKFYLKHFLIGVVTLATPWIINAQTSTTTDTTEQTIHWGHEYDDSDWQKNFTLSFGADAVRSNANVSTSNNTTSLSADPKWGYGAMGALELGVADFAGIAVGAHYLERRFQISGGPVNWTRSIPTVMIPVEARFYVLKVISIGVGGFAAIAAGKVHDSFSNGNSTLVQTGAARSGADFGLTGALGVNIPLGPLGVFGEARYNYGLTNSGTNSEVEEKIRDLLFTVGVKFKI